MRMIDTLQGGSLDIVGDIHGEIDALDKLLDHLGYDADGNHKYGRRLVFVGDLVDRGRDSPAVVERVMKLVDANRAQCILGNHELTILRSEPKQGNEWFFHSVIQPASGSGLVGKEQRTRFLDFFGRLPLALESDELRIVHACWSNNAVSSIKSRDSGPLAVAELYSGYEKQIDAELIASGVMQTYKEEKAKFGERIAYGRNRPKQHWPDPVMLPGHAHVDETRQMKNAVKVLTSGEERICDKPFPASGKFRFVERVKWWEGYDEGKPVVVGHYWRRFSDFQTDELDKHGPDLFAGVKPGHWLGRRENVYCVDFSVGGRSADRSGKNVEKHFRLAALRWPERVVVFDDGYTLETS